MRENDRDNEGKRCQGDNEMCSYKKRRDRLALKGVVSIPSLDAVPGVLFVDGECQQYLMMSASNSDAGV